MVPAFSDRRAWLAAVVASAADAFGLGHEAEFSVAGVTLPVLGFFGEEWINGGYRYDLALAVNDVAYPLLQASLGQPGAMTIKDEPRPRLVTGVVAECELIEPRPNGRLYRVGVIPRLQRLRHTLNSRVYQDMSVPEIVADVLDRAALEHRWLLAADYPERPYCLQYAESDLAFVTRLLREECLTSFFEHLDAGTLSSGEARGPYERLVISDTASSYRWMAQQASTLRYRPEQAAAARGAATARDAVTSFAVRQCIGPEKVTLRDYDFSLAAPTPGAIHPSGNVADEHAALQHGAFTTKSRAGVQHGVRSAEIYDHRHRLNWERQSPETARRTLKQERRLTAVYHGSSWCRRLAPAVSFMLLDYPAELWPPDGKVTVTRVFHSCVWGGAGDAQGYSNVFEAVPGDYLMPPEAPVKRQVETLQTATVVGTVGRTIETEQFGRVKIQFHWDRTNSNDETSSIWVRVAQVWSGAQYGFQFVPRIGSEVLVGFLGGDPDHPVIVGSLPNVANPLPQQLPQDQTRSAIRSQSVPSTGGYNEILFNDRAKEELLAFRAERNHQITVNHDHRLEVGASSFTSVADKLSLRVGGDTDEHNGGSAMLRVDKNRSIVIGGTKRETTIRDSILRVGGHSSTNVRGFCEHTVQGDWRLIVGTSERSLALTQVNGEYRVGASTLLQLESASQIRLKVGPSVIEIDEDGIRLQAPRVSLVATSEIESSAPSWRLLAQDSVHVQGHEVQVVAAGSSLVLDQNASLDGALVLLNCGGEAPAPLPDPAAAQTEQAVFRVVPPAGMEGPFTLVISGPDGSSFEVETDAEHKAVVTGAPGDRFVLTQVKKGDAVLDQNPKGQS